MNALARATALPLLCHLLRCRYDQVVDLRDPSLLGPGGVDAMAQCCGYALLVNMDNNDGLWAPAFLAKLRAARSGGLEVVAWSEPLVFAQAVQTARRRGDFCAFFRLLRAAPHVEACALSNW